jgi:hypothetical protein
MKHPIKLTALEDDLQAQIKINSDEINQNDPEKTGSFRLRRASD